MSTLKNCPICGTKPAEASRQASGGESGWKDAWLLDCPRCGKFVILDAAAPEIGRRKINLALVSAWIRQESEHGADLVVIKRSNVDRLAAMQFPSLVERIESYVLALARRSQPLGQSVNIFNDDLIAHGYCSSRDELEEMATYLCAQGYLRWTQGGDEGVLTSEGHIFGDTLRNRRAESSQGFIAMWFDQAMEEARRVGLEPGIRKAGYKPHRVDDAQHIDKIDDRIIAEIRRWKFLVADLTGHRGGVYYEAGFALGLSKPVFYTCRADHAEEFHFDIRQFNYIKWDTPAELAVSLQARIEAVLGLGPEPTA